jgi:quinol monooxygenase YgiN
MITVAGRIAIRAEMRSQAVAAAVKVTRATKTDAGCLQYHFYSDLEDPNMLHVFEEWESAEALTAHLAQSHTTEFLAEIANMVAGAPLVKRYVVSESGSLH